MRPAFFRQTSRAVLASLLLTAFVLRALIPAGYMPSRDIPFTLEICPVGFPAHLLATYADQHSGEHQHATGHHKGGEHDGSHHDDASIFSHCVFGSATLTGPASELPSVLIVRIASFEPRVVLPQPIVQVRRFHVQQPRAPPLFS
jgi:hypothetical protein